jgi:hypothetical protein
LISLSEVAAVHLENQPTYLERFNIYPVIVITAGLDGDLSLAEARFLCERLVTDAIRERARAANPLRWLRPMPPAKAPARSGGAPDRPGGPWHVLGQLRPVSWQPDGPYSSFRPVNQRTFK